MQMPGGEGRAGERERVTERRREKEKREERYKEAYTKPVGVHRRNNWGAR